MISFDCGWTYHGCERKKNVVLRSLENVEEKLNISQNVDSCGIGLLDRLSGLEYSNDEKLNSKIDWWRASEFLRTKRKGSWVLKSS